MQIVPQREGRKQRDKNGVEELNQSGDGRAEGTGRDVGNSSPNSSLNCEAGRVCEEGRTSEMKELPHLIPNAVHHDLQARPWLVWAS